MLNKFILIILNFGIITVLLGFPRMVISSLGSEKEFNTVLEYGIISGDHSCFVMNQPYDYHTTIDILNQSTLSSWTEILIKRFAYLRPKEKMQERIFVKISPGISGSNSETTESMVMMKADGVITIGDLVIVNRFRLNDAELKIDPEFHGDTGEWLFGYFDESYATIKLYDKVELFLGRISRNFGALNDYGLILSNNPYAFDHFGFTATGHRLKYSFYLTRLNDILGQDSQGHTMPLDTLMQTKRYWAIQRLDWQIEDNFQIALSEAIVYGGPDQNWVASYMNPTQFFYAAQRNQHVQLNSMWQINVFWKPKQGLGFYVDLFADDLIINNDPGVNDREKKPDRLGYLLKTSITDLILSETLTSLRYVRIWNDTYTSYRTFENYAYFNKRIGFPFNSYEGLKITWNWLGGAPVFLQSEIELWRHGGRDLYQAYDGVIKDFPLPPVTYGITSEFRINIPYWKNVEFEFRLKNQLTSLSKTDFFNDNHSMNEFYLKLLYQFDFIL